MADRIEDKILVKAKQLAKDDGRLWLWGPDGKDNDRSERLRLADESLRAEYISRARHLMRPEKG